LLPYLPVPSPVIILLYLGIQPYPPRSSDACGKTFARRHQTHPPSFVQIGLHPIIRISRSAEPRTAIHWSPQGRAHPERMKSLAPSASGNMATSPRGRCPRLAGAGSWAIYAVAVGMEDCGRPGGEVKSGSGSAGIALVCGSRGTAGDKHQGCTPTPTLLLSMRFGCNLDPCPAVVTGRLRPDSRLFHSGGTRQGWCTETCCIHTRSAQTCSPFPPRDSAG